MLERLKIQNFKSLKDVDVELRGLNLLAGLNSSGKSSLIHVLLLMKQSLSRDNPATIYLNGNYIKLGKVRDVFYEFSKINGFLFKIKYTEKYTEDSLIHTIETITDLEADYLSPNLTLPNQFRNWERFYNALPFSNFQYIASNRGEAKTQHLTSSFGREKQIGLNGEFSFHFLAVFGSNTQIVAEKLQNPNAKSLKLLDQVNAWLSLITPGAKLNVTETPSSGVLGDFEFNFKDKNDSSSRYKPMNVGLGLSFALPVVLALLLAEPDRLIIIENPETYLHPQGQAELGKLMALAAAAGAQIIAETHSDHLINGIRVAVKKGMIPPKDAQILFFEKIDDNNEQYSEVTPIHIDQFGELSAHPVGFMDEWGRQLFELI